MALILKINCQSHTSYDIPFGIIVIRGVSLNFGFQILKIIGFSKKIEFHLASLAFVYPKTLIRELQKYLLSYINLTGLW